MCPGSAGPRRHGDGNGRVVPAGAFQPPDIAGTCGPARKIRSLDGVQPVGIQARKEREVRAEPEADRQPEASYEMEL